MASEKIGANASGENGLPSLPHIASLEKGNPPEARVTPKSPEAPGETASQSVENGKALTEEEFKRKLADEFIRQRLMQLARKRTRNDADAKDLVQNTLLKALQKRGMYIEDRNFLAWLSAILHNGYIYLRFERESRTICWFLEKKLNEKWEKSALLHR